MQKSTMDANLIGISVGAEDLAALETFMRELPETPEEADIVESRSLDGETLITVLVFVSVHTFPYIRDWLVARTKARKKTSVTLSGEVTKLDGFSAREIERLVPAIERLAESKKSSKK
jgi:hypothetical protein